MKKNEFNKLKDKSLGELVELVHSKKLEVSKLQVKIATGKEKNIKLIKNLRKEIAQIFTLINILDKKELQK